MGCREPQRKKRPHVHCKLTRARRLAANRFSQCHRSRRADGSQTKSRKVKAEINYTEKIMSRKFNKAKKLLFFQD